MCDVNPVNYHKYIQNDGVEVDILITTGSVRLYDPRPPFLSRDIFVTLDIFTTVGSSCIVCDSEVDFVLGILDIPLGFFV